MPLPVAAPAAGAFYAGAVAASKHLVIHAAPLLDVTSLSYAAIGFWMVRYFWRNKVPQWAKDDVSLRNLLRRKSDNKAGVKEEENLTASEREDLELANFSSVLAKIRALVSTIKLGEDHPTLMQQHAALLAYVQLCSQVKMEETTLDEKNTSDRGVLEEKKDEAEAWTSRDSLYSNSHVYSSTIDPQYYAFASNPKESPLNATLQEALQFSAFAYYDDETVLSEKLDHHDCSLVEHSLVSPRPGFAAYYLAVSSLSKKQLILGIRGTSSVEDIVTDCCGRSVPLDDRPYYYDHDRGSRRNQLYNYLDPSRIEVEASKPHEILHDQNEVEVISGLEQIRVEDELDIGSRYHPFYCHEGCLVSAKRLADTVQEQVEYWVLERGYKLVVTGHSLGAGVASLTAAILRSRLPELIHCGGASPKMHVFCFAPPPVLDRETALAASSYTTSVVCNADIIPRCTMENLIILLETLKCIWQELERQGWAPTGPKTTAAFFQRIAKGSEQEMLMSGSSLRSIMRKSLEKVQLNEKERVKMDTAQLQKSCAFSSSVQIQAQEAVAEGEEDCHPSLFIPGVVLLGFETWHSSGAILQSTTQDCEVQPEEFFEGDAISRQPHRWIVTDGTANVLRFLDVDASPRMFMDHTTTSYYSLMDLEYSF